MVFSRRILGGGALLVILIAGCATIDELAPPVNESMASAAAPVSQLQQGRHIYLTACARCHSPERVMRYTRQQWREILPRMSKDTALSQEEHEAVEAYIIAVLSSGVRRGEASPEQKAK